MKSKFLSKEIFGYEKTINPALLIASSKLEELSK